MLTWWDLTGIKNYAMHLDENKSSCPDNRGGLPSTSRRFHWPISDSIGANIETKFIKTHLWLPDLFKKSAITRSVKLIALNYSAEDSQIQSNDLNSRHIVLTEQLTSQMCNQNDNWESRMYE